MIYDEGFEVAMDDYVYFAFSGFDFVNQGGKKTNVSHCGATQIGWYHNKERTAWGCYLGRRVDTTDSSPDAQPHVPESSHRVSLAAQTEDVFTRLRDDDEQGAQEPVDNALQSSDAEPNSPSQESPWVPHSAGFDKPMPSEWQQSVADPLNFLQLGWTATKYEIFDGKTPRQLNKLAGVRHARQIPHLKPRDEPKQFESFLGLGSRVRRVQRISTADSFDWRNANGENWLQPVVTQGDCGSCYTISTVHMLTARNRIKHGDKTQPAFSVSFPLYCAEYNQGCDGGYGFLQTKWSEDVGLVPESCSPFSQGGGSCGVTHGCDLGNKRYRATNHHYVGGFYGGSDADAIRKELVAGGPLVMSFEPQEDFMYYKTGVYRSG